MERILDLEFLLHMRVLHVKINSETLLFVAYLIFGMLEVWMSAECMSEILAEN